MLDAAVEWFRRNPVSRSVDTNEQFGFAGATVKSPGRASWDVPRLEVVYDRDGDVRLRAR